ncbi:MAG TPA: hypothetical protein VHA33_06230 [Candidatus Angelobacter sp.]|jgi:hypothetical protein|nr:hypothetical protein [Candidatus Angelobacter sp.]
MKLKLFLFLASALLAGRAMAQGCSTNPIPFPLPGNADKMVPSGTCIANVDEGGQGGRLRWDNNGSHILQLFDADDAGQSLWCDNSGSGCIPGSILCLQQDGNMVMYSPSPGQGTIDCGRSDGDGGQAVWASNTQHKNDSHEELAVGEDVLWLGVIRTGDRAVVRNGSGAQWVSTGFTD